MSGTTVTVNENGTVTVTAEPTLPEEGLEFFGWEIDGEIVSKDEVYTFTVSEDTVIKAVYVEADGDAEIEPIVIILIILAVLAVVAVIIIIVVKNKKKDN